MSGRSVAPKSPDLLPDDNDVSERAAEVVADRLRACAARARMEGESWLADILIYVVEEGDGEMFSRLVEAEMEAGGK